MRPLLALLRGISNSYCRNESGDDNFALAAFAMKRRCCGARKKGPFVYRRGCIIHLRFRTALSFFFPHGFYFSFIATERADYNCKCYHKPDLTPARGEMNWHVGVKLHAESAGGPYDERRTPASCCEWPRRERNNVRSPSGLSWASRASRAINLRAALNHRCCHHPRYLPPPPTILTISYLYNRHRFTACWSACGTDRSIDRAYAGSGGLNKSERDGRQLGP